jgi:thioredoxin 1
MRGRTIPRKSRESPPEAITKGAAVKSWQRFKNNQEEENNMEMIKGTEFEEKVLKSDKPVIVDFFATWCGPCKALAPILTDLDTAMEGRVHIYKVDIDDEDNLQQILKYEVQAVPTVLFIKDGQVVQKMVGVESRESIANATLSLFE